MQQYEFKIFNYDKFCLHIYDAENLWSAIMYELDHLWHREYPCYSKDVIIQAYLKMLK